MIARKKRLLIISVFVILTVISTVVPYFMLSRPMDLSSYHPRIESLIESATGKRVTIKKVVLQVFPRTRVELGGVELMHGDSPLIELASVRFGVSALALVSGRPFIDDLDIEGAKLTIRRDAAGAVNIAQFFQGAQAAPAGRSEWRLRRPVIRSLRLTGGTVYFEDRSTKAPVRLEVTGIAVTLKEKAKGYDYLARGVLRPYTRIILAGRFTHDPAAGYKLSGKSGITGLQLDTLNPYIMEAAHGAYVKGTATIASSYGYDEASDAAVIDSSVVYGSLEAAPGAMKPIASEAGSLRLKASWHHGGLSAELKDADLTVDGFRARGSARIAMSAGGGKKPFEMTLSTTSVPAEKFMGYVPTAALPKEAGKKLKDFELTGGGVTVEELRLGGYFEDLFPDTKDSPTFSMRVGLDNLDMVYKPEDELLSALAGHVYFKDKDVFFEDVSGDFSSGTVEKLVGNVTGLAGKARFDVNVKAKLDAGKTLASLKKHSKTGDTDFWSRINNTDMTGHIGIVFNLKGGFDGTALAYTGAATLEKTGFYYRTLPVKVASSKGMIIFDNKKLTFRDVIASDSTGSEAKLNGTVSDYLDQNLSYSLSSSGRLTQATVAPFVNDGPAKGLSFKGLVPYSAILEGKPGELRSTVSLNLTPVELEYKKLIKKAASYPSAVNASFIIKGDSLTLTGMDVTFGGSKVSVTGGYAVKSGAYSLTVSSPRIYVDDLDDVSPYFLGDFASKGELSLNLRVSKSAADKPIAYEGEVALKDASFNTLLLAKPVENLNAHLRLRPGEITATLDNITVGRSTVSAKLYFTEVDGGFVRFEAESGSLYLDDFLREKPSTSDKDPLREIRELISAIRTEAGAKAPARRKPLTGAGSIRVKEGFVYGQRVEDVTVEVRIDKEAVYLAPVVTINGGMLRGAVAYYLDPDNALLYDADLRLYGSEIEPAIKALGATERIMSGRLSGTARIYGNRGAVPFSSGINGDVSLSCAGGRMWEFVVMSKIFSIVNIVSIGELFKDGLPYKLTAGDFTIKNGIIRTENLRFDSDSMRMSAVGAIDVPERKIDAVLAMHPFVTIDKIITKIPLAGWIIGGKQQSTVSMYYGIKGPLKDPDINPVPIKAMGEGILGMLQRLIEAPAEGLKTIMQ